MIRIATFAAASVVACAAAPAEAASIFQIGFSGIVTGSQSQYDPSRPSCMGGGPASEFCYSIIPFSQSVGGTAIIIGDTPNGTFEVGDNRLSGLITGTIVGSVLYGLSGVDLSFNRSRPGSRDFQVGSAATFEARLLTIDGAPAPAPLPEPATWAMMIAGFGAIGGAMRARRRTARVRIALA